MGATIANPVADAAISQVLALACPINLALETVTESRITFANADMPKNTLPVGADQRHPDSPFSPVGGMSLARGAVAAYVRQFGTATPSRKLPSKLEITLGYNRFRVFIASLSSCSRLNGNAL